MTMCENATIMVPDMEKPMVPDMEKPMVPDMEKPMKPVKNRTNHITELFEALPKVEGFNYSTEELWEFFNKACKDKNINIRKLSEKKGNKKDADKPPKKLTGYNMFTSQKGKTMEEKSAGWNALSEAEKKEWKDRADEKNKENGFEPKQKPLTYKEQQEQWTQRHEQWVQRFKKWAVEDPNTRGEEPEEPTKPVKAVKATNKEDKSE